MESGFLRHALRILFTPYDPSCKFARVLKVFPEGMNHALRIVTTLSRVAKAAARLEASYLRYLDARHGYLTKYSLPYTEDQEVAPDARRSR